MSPITEEDELVEDVRRSLLTATSLLTSNSSPYYHSITGNKNNSPVTVSSNNNNNIKNEHIQKARLYLCCKHPEPELNPIPIQPTENTNNNNNNNTNSNSNFDSESVSRKDRLRQNLPQVYQQMPQITQNNDDCKCLLLEADPKADEEIVRPVSSNLNVTSVIERVITEHEPEPMLESKSMEITESENNDNIATFDGKNGKHGNPAIVSIPGKVFAAKFGQNPYKNSRKARKQLTIFSVEEVALHNHKKSCWIIVNNLVLDVTKFIKYHPGSKNAIVKHGGEDCTRHFDFHSRLGKQLHMRFVIGRVGNDKDTNVRCGIQ